MNGKRYFIDKKFSDYKKEVIKQAKLIKGDTPLLKGGLFASIIFYMEMPMSWPTWKYTVAMYEPEAIAHTVKPDLDNLAKGILDALNEVVYKDDNQIIDMCVFKRWESADHQPGVRIVIQENGIEPCQSMKRIKNEKK